MTIPDGVAPLELYTAPDTGAPYLEVGLGRTRLLARYAPDGPTTVDATWARDHADVVADGHLAPSRIGGVSFAAVPVVVRDLSAENEHAAWPSPLVLGAEIATQHQICLDPAAHAWAVVPTTAGGPA